MSILVTGATGQIGTILTRSLREVYGTDQVLASDIRRPLTQTGPFVMLDIVNVQRISEIVEDHNITEIYHLAAILSANGEWNPEKTWNVNLNGLLSILEIAREKEMKKVFFPSTIAVFGKTTPRNPTGQDVPLLPETVYGMSKAAGEMWCHYYHQRYGLDIRCLRYPGIIGHDSDPGGGTTDYAVEIFHEALAKGTYTCFLDEGTRLPMMYMDDAVRATIELMQAPSEKIKLRHGYNIAGFSMSPGELATEIKRHIPNFEIHYEPDFRQAIAESWTEVIDDQRARDDWNWQAKYDLDLMTKDMISKLTNSYKPSF